MTAGKPALRICIVLPDLDIGGAQRVMLLLAGEFAAQGYQVEIVSLIHGGDLLVHLPAGVGYRALLPGHVQSQFMLALRGLPPLVHYLRRERPDAVLSTMTGTNLLCVTAHRLAGRRGRLVLREAASLRNVKGAVKKGLMRWLYPRADAVIGVSNGVRNDLEQLGIPVERLHAINNPVDAVRLRALANDHGASKRLLDDPYIVNVGRLTLQKDHDSLLRAYASSESRKDHKLVLVGEGPLRDTLMALVDQLEIGGRVVWLGALDNPYAVMAGARLHVLASRWEGYPNVLLESLALGVPVVATDAPWGASEVLDKGRYGRLVPVGDVTSLASAMDVALLRPSALTPWPVVDHAPNRIARGYLDVLFQHKSDRL